MTQRKLFSDTITDEQYRKLTRPTLDYERKPNHPNDVRSSINFGELDKSIQGIVSNLPTVEFLNSFFDNTLDGDQQFYLMTYNEQIYLVDTQGFKYARYVIRLKDFVILERAETQQMKTYPGMVEEIIGMLRHMDVDGETMEYILQQTAMKTQMLRQLLLKADKDVLWDLSLEREKLAKNI
jgi:hypothetical protein